MPIDRIIAAAGKPIFTAEARRRGEEQGQELKSTCNGPLLGV